MTDERRRTPRHPLTLTVHTGGRVLWTENVSEGGVFVQQHELAAIGTAFSGELSFPGFLPAQPVRGRVAWQRSGTAWQPAGVGVEIDAADLPLLHRIVTAYEKRDTPTTVRESTILVVRASVPKLSRPGIRLEMVTTGDEARARAMETAPRLVVTDLFAPLSESLRLVQEIRSRLNAPLVVVSSGNPDDDARALGAGAAAVIDRRGHLPLLIETASVLTRL